METIDRFSGRFEPGTLAPYPFRGKLPEVFRTPGWFDMFVWNRYDVGYERFYPQALLIYEGQTLVKVLVPQSMQYGLWNYPDIAYENPGPDDPAPLEFPDIETAVLTMELLY